MMEMLGALMKGWDFLKLSQDEFGRASILGTPFFTLGGDRTETNDNNNDIFPELNKALSSTSYIGKTRKKDGGILLMNNINDDSGYTGDGVKSTKREIFLLSDLPKKLLKLKVEL